ncbi:MAG: type II toxin-antitoxin system VapC family toxin [Gammaproteobacteria bacterium]|nr:type II toxin-antitoxin system VapC family toxin [Gammaproteobacteria bacterium]MYG67535.1 type II toxin-antitoxin system VapC family toxin [Gammaproteobacteria bacterium]
MGILERFVDRKIYLDTNIFIFILEGPPTYQQILDTFMDAVEDGRVSCYSSELALAEALVIPFRKGYSEHVSQYSQLLQDEKFVTLIPTDRRIFFGAAFYRAGYNLTLPDAIHVASAINAGYDILLTNDRRPRVSGQLELMHLE